MYNPYNWIIRNDIKKECKKRVSESNYEYQNRLMNLLGKFTAELSVARIGYDLAVMNLKDSLNLEKTVNELDNTVDFDIQMVQKKRKEIKQKMKYIVFVKEKIDEIK